MGESVASDHARGFGPVDDGPLGDNHRHARGRGLLLAGDHRQIVVYVDAARLFAIRGLAHGLDQARTPFVASAEAVDQARIERGLRSVPPGSCESAADVIDVCIDCLSRELAARGNVVAHDAPQAAEQVARGLAVFVGHVVAGKRLGEGLVFADAEDVHLHAEPVERIAEIGSVACQAAQQDEAVG